MQSQFNPKKYYINTFGCQANIADSNTIAGVLEALGLEPAKKMEESDVFIINTCSVRQKSEDKVYGMGKKFFSKKNNTKLKNPPFTIMAGCMVGSVKGERKRYDINELKEKTPWVNEYISPAEIMTIPEILHKNNLLDEWAIKKFDPNNVTAIQPDKKHAFVNISYGCDNFCTFCVVPYARGREVSRDKKDILKEINHLVNRGFTQITLCGQNVNSWNLPMDKKFEIRTGSNQQIPFAALLREIHNIKQIEKIDFLSSNPFDFTQDLIDTIKLPKISPYLHIAVQSGNNEILKKMNRRHTIEDFKKLVKKLQKAKPNLELGTDVIVGFPTETKKQFEDTIQLFKDIKFNVAFISIYSPRKGTPAAKFFKDDVPLTEKKRRHAELTKVWKASLNE